MGDTHAIAAPYDKCQEETQMGPRKQEGGAPPQSRGRAFIHSFIQSLCAQGSSVPGTAQVLEAQP